MKLPAFDLSQFKRQVPESRKPDKDCSCPRCRYLRSHPKSLGDTAEKRAQRRAIHVYLESYLRAVQDREQVHFAAVFSTTPYGTLLEIAGVPALIANMLRDQTIARLSGQANPLVNLQFLSARDVMADLEKDL